jgi:hypothetical protein
MKTIDGVLLEGKLGRFISQGCYNIGVTTYATKTVDGFENFTEEAHLYALLEWSRFPRPESSEKDRLKYLYEKCLEYTECEKWPVFEIIDTPFGYAVCVQEEEELPF